MLIYQGGDVDSTVNIRFYTKVDNVTVFVKSFDDDIVLDYVGVIRYPIIMTF